MRCGGRKQQREEMRDTLPPAPFYCGVHTPDFVTGASSWWEPVQAVTQSPATRVPTSSQSMGNLFLSAPETEGLGTISP